MKCLFKFMKILIAVIAYNEEANLRKTLKDLIDNDFGYDIVVIDNGSSDKTAEVAKEFGVYVVSHCINSGSSMGTVMTYFLYAKKFNYDILCQFDGDGQHIASELKKIIQPIIEEKADYVIGSRFIDKKGYQSLFLRRIGIGLFSKIVSFVVGYKITDVTSGFRAYNKKVFGFFASKYRHELYDTSQLLLISHYSGSKITEIPVEMKERVHGKSEFNIMRSIIYPIHGLITIIGCILQKKQY